MHVGLWPSHLYRPTQCLLPHNVKWIKQSAAKFDPDNSVVILGDGTRVTYKAS